MRVHLINLNLIDQDAIGQCIQNQARFFRHRGDVVRIYYAVAAHRRAR